MPSTVSACFQKFRDDFVDLPTDLTKTARSSRDFLYEQIKNLKDATILAGDTQSFGSFARRTKTRPLDDIDCLATLKCGGTSEIPTGNSYAYELRVNQNTAALAAYSDSTGYVNSTKVLNAVKSALEKVPQYRQSDIGRNGSAVVLNLKSYDWSFDVVPSCPVSNSSGAITHYLIPDGKGKWKRTDPRKDATRVEDANTRNNGRFLPAARLLKYWNRRRHKPELPSYYFETILTNRALTDGAYPSLQNALERLFAAVRETVLSTCPDPKGHEPALDRDVAQDTKNKVYEAAGTALSAAQKAINAEISGDHKLAISYWASIFGADFPAYG